MAGLPSARQRRAALALLTVALSAAALSGMTLSDTAASALSSRSQGHNYSRPVDAGSGYLALGDSVAFGYREPANLPTPDYTRASNFVGYPEDVAAALGLRLANASCPGETSGSLLSATQLSYVCKLTPTGDNGYRTQYPLHVSYSGTQLQYALRYLKQHRGTRLVTLMIGANDAFLCEATTSDACASELPSVLAKISSNVATILRSVRQRAHYRGQIVIVNYYSVDYRSATANASSQGLNQAMDSAARPYHVSFADGYGAFRKAAAQAGGDTCAAGLLTTLTTGGCGVHPSVAGQALLALSVERAIKR